MEDYEFNLLWIFKSLQYNDFSYEELIGISFLICINSEGGITFDNIKDFTFEQLVYALEKAKEIQDKKIEGMKGNR